jgi:hypothetical protein
MKISKKTAMLASFAVGALLFATTALADIATKSGYDQLKDGIKATAEKCTNGFDSYTMDFSVAVKDNGKTLSAQNETQKYDRSKNSLESTNEGENQFSGKYHTYYYIDDTAWINQNSNDPTYYVTESDKNVVRQARSNPFKEPRVADMERIADALVGSLKDQVVVTEKPDGSKELSGSLSEVQIPPLVNAVSSFFFKQQYGGNNKQYGGNNQQMPQLTQDIFVKSIKGNAVVNKDGVMESILANAVLSGKDDKGQLHELTVDLVFKLSGVNSTTVSKPDLTGKKVVKQEAKQGPQISNPQEFVGKWKNDIIIEKDGKFVKIGERIIDIAHMDAKTVAGRYHEEYRPGFEEYAAGTKDFSFDSSFDKNNPTMAPIQYTTKSGGTGHGDISIDQHGPRLYFNFQDATYTGSTNYNPMYCLVLN